MMKRNSKIDSSCQETTPSDHVPTHPAVLAVFRTDNILEEICSHLDFNDLKQFRLVSTTCSNEGRRALIKRDQHWVVVKSKDDDWQLQPDNVLGKLEKTSSRGENCNKKLLGWIFKRLELNYWEHSLGHSDFLQQWGHYLRKIHLKDQSDSLSISNCISIIHHLLTVCCPNLEEVVVDADNLKQEYLSLVVINELDGLEFPSPLLKLKCLRVKRLHMVVCTTKDIDVLQRFITKLIRAAGTALETLKIEYGSAWVEGRMLESLALHEGVHNFQALTEITLETADNVANLSHMVQKCFPKLTKLILGRFYSETVVGIRSEAFPALKSLKIHSIRHDNITSGRTVDFLQHFSNLEVFAIFIDEEGSWPIISDPFVPPLKSLRSFTFATKDYKLLLLRCAVDMFPNLVTLNLLAFGRQPRLYSRSVRQPEYSFGELMDIISPLNCLQHLYVNHAFHTSPQLVDAIQLTSNLTDLQTFVLFQAAHDYTEQDFNVSLCLTTSDPDFQYILDCDCVKRLKLVRLSAFRFGTTQEEVEEEAAAKGGHVSFGTMCPYCYLEPWKCCKRKRGILCKNSGGRPIYHA